MRRIRPRKDRKRNLCQDKSGRRAAQNAPHRSERADTIRVYTLGYFPRTLQTLAGLQERENLKRAGNCREALLHNNKFDIRRPKIGRKAICGFGLLVLQAIGGSARRIRATRIISVMSIAMAVRTITMRTILMGLLRSDISKRQEK